MTALSEPPASMPARADDLEALVRTHHQSVWRALRYFGADASEADDLTQETFMAIVRKGFEQQGERQTAAFLRLIAKNQLLMLRRKQKREVDTVQIEAAESVWVQQIERDGWETYTELLNECVEKLEGRAAQAIDLSYRQSVGRQEIADQIGMTPDGVKTLLRRTRGVLKECVEKATRRKA